MKLIMNHLLPDLLLGKPAIKTQYVAKKNICFFLKIFLHTNPLNNHV